MDLEPQRSKNDPKRKLSDNLPRVEEDEELEVTEGMTERDHKTEDLKDSPLKIFMNTEIFLLIAGLIVGAIYFFFFRGL